MDNYDREMFDYMISEFIGEDWEADHLYDDMIIGGPEVE